MTVTTKAAMNSVMTNESGSNGLAPEPASEKTATSSPEAAPALPSPLDYILGVMRDPAVEPGRRDEMAKLALPYMHPKAAAEPGGSDAGPAAPVALSENEIARRIAFTLAKAVLGASSHDEREIAEARLAD